MVYIFETVHISSSKIGKLAWIRIPTWFLWKSINVIAACSYVGFGSSLNHQRLIRNLTYQFIQNRNTVMDPDPNMVSYEEYKCVCCVFLRRQQDPDPPSATRLIRNLASKFIFKKLIWIWILNLVSMAEYKCYYSVLQGSKSWL